MEQSIKVQPTEHTVLTASPIFAGPSKKNCLAQVSYVHRLRDSEEKYEDHQFDTSMKILRNREGIGAPLKICMDLFAARKIGRLPFLQSSNIMEDVLLGRDEIMSFSDFLGVQENFEQMNLPQAVMEKDLAIF